MQQKDQNHERPHLLMCSPDHYGIQHVINPWMEGHVNKIDSELARQQWQNLHHILSQVAQLTCIPSVPNLPDMVFSANAGLCCNNRVIPTQFRVTQRQGEMDHFIQWFQDRQMEVQELIPDQPFEGEGDALFQPGEALLWAGYGIRTSIESHPALVDFFQCEVVSLRLIDPRFYHLDTCFLPLPGGRLVYWPQAFDEQSRAEIRNRIPADRRIEVSEDDALRFACNAICVGNQFIANAFSPALSQQLGEWGFETIACDVSEFMKAGGGVKCLALRVDQPAGTGDSQGKEFTTPVRTARLAMSGHILDTGKLNQTISTAMNTGSGCRIENLLPGEQHDQPSQAQLRITAASQSRLDELISDLLPLGAKPLEDHPHDAVLERCPKDGVAPEEFYSSTIFPTEIMVNGQWIKAQQQRMDATLVVNPTEGTASCRIMRDLKAGEWVVVGHQGLRVAMPEINLHGEGFAFMSAGVSSERRVEQAVEELAWDMQRCVERGAKIAVVSGPVVIHTGGGPYLEKMIRHGFVHTLLTGNALPVHDIESQMFGTSLGVDLARGQGVRGGHRHHLRAINRVRRAGSIREAVEQEVIQSGIMHACVKNDVRYVLSGSIRDDGPLPDTLMDLEEAQRQYADALKGCEIILMLSTMLHAIGVGNMTPAGVKLICVDINPAVVTKLADRGSVESIGIVTDVGLFMNLLASKLCAAK